MADKTTPAPPPTLRGRSTGGKRPSDQYLTQKVDGRFWDRIERRDPKTGAVTVEETPVRTNKIVISLPRLLAGLLKNEGTFTGGILFHAVGEGDLAWDTSPIPPPSWQDTELLDEFFRKAPDSITYVDDMGAPVIPGPSNILQVRTTFDYEDAGANGHFFREQGLTGGDATVTLDSGHFVDVIRHKAIWKDEFTRIIRFIQLIF